MHLILRIIGGLLLVAVGCLFVIKSEWLLQNFGSVSWAEQHLGLDGGTRLFYKLLGIIIALIGIAMATGLLGSILLGTLSTRFGGKSPAE